MSGPVVGEPCLEENRLVVRKRYFSIYASHTSQHGLGVCNRLVVLALFKKVGAAYEKKNFIKNKK